MSGNALKAQDMSERDQGAYQLDEKNLTSGEILKKIRIDIDEFEDNPENNLVLMLHEQGDRVGTKFAPAVSHLLSPDTIHKLYEEINSEEEFVLRGRELIKELLGQLYP